jgi:hypothetical protein
MQDALEIQPATDDQGEVYVLASNGTISRLVAG